MRATVKRSRGGRPPKFAEPRRPVTLTLPERTLRRLETLDPDRARAIVTATDAACGEASEAAPVEIVEVAPGKGILLVGPSRTLRSIPWLILAEIAPRRYLLTVTPGTPVEGLEIALLDLLQEVPAAEERERAILEELAKHLRALRRERKIEKAEMLFVPIPRRRK
jgi:hypothetical protein